MVSGAHPAADEELRLAFAKPHVERLPDRPVLHEAGVVVDDQRRRHASIADEVLVSGDSQQAQARLAALLVRTQNVALAARLEVDFSEPLIASH